MKTKLFPLMSLLLIVGFAGCAGGVRNSMRLSEKDSAWNPLARLTEEKKKEATDKEAKPVTMAAIWKDSVYEKPGERTVVGFGGRFFFYDRDNNSVQAEGELVVYGYEDSDDSESKAGEGADKKFVFRESEFQSHFSDTGLGASYSVWIPWEKMGGYRKSITLIPYFKTTDGRLLESGQSIVILPGKTSSMQSAESDPDQPYKVLGHSSAVVSHASYQPKRSAKRASMNSGTNRDSSKSNVSQASFEQASSDGTNTKKIKTSQINLPQSMARRMASASARERYERLQEERKAEIARMNSAHSAWTQPSAQPNANGAPQPQPQSQMPAQPEMKQPEPSADPVAPPARARTFGSPGGF